jgi:hypothetical protein
VTLGVREVADHENLPPGYGASPLFGLLGFGDNLGISLGFSYNVSSFVYLAVQRFRMEIQTEEAGLHSEYLVHSDPNAISSNHLPDFIHFPSVF